MLRILQGVACPRALDLANPQKYRRPALPGNPSSILFIDMTNAAGGGRGSKGELCEELVEFVV
jgi:hypothetical protein